MRFSSQSLFMAASLLGSTSAHMIMKTPTPFGVSTLNNSPLNADGSDFPCKQRSGVYDAQGASNTMPIGSKQTLSFTGSAVHGGGSCQVSLTTDKQPSKSTKWQVIHSIEGGCPAKGQDGNLPDGTNDPDTYEFTVPDGIAAGEYVLAWTWFNRIGNREMYMNCAPVTVTGGSSKAKRGVDRRREATPGLSRRATSFPDMFLANIGNGCTSADSKDLVFPDPGDSLEKDGDAANLAPPTGSCGSSAPAGGSSGGASGASSASGSSPTGGAFVGSVSSPAATPTVPPTSAPSSVVVISPSPSSGSESGAGSGSSTGSGVGSGSSAGSGSSDGTGATPSSSAAPASGTSSTGSGAGAGSSSSSGSSGALSGPCSTEGTFNCIGGSQFQQCASGSWSVAQPMAAGVQCTSGQSSTLAMEAVAVGQ